MANAKYCSVWLLHMQMYSSLYYLRFLFDLSAIRFANSDGRIQPSFFDTFMRTPTISSRLGAATRIPKQRDLIAGIT